MLVLFSLIVMRMTGAIALHPILGRTNLPVMARAALIFACSVLLYGQSGGILIHSPSGMLEYGVMLLSELMLGFAMGFVTELIFLVVRFASAVMDFSMGLSMAQIYDPQYNLQTTVTSGLFYTFLAMLFLAANGHVELLALFFASSQLIPFGQPVIRPELAELMMDIFSWSILTGFKLAFPLLAAELLAETAVGIIMRIIPQINVFVVNFQIKIAAGLLMLVFLFSPMSDMLKDVLGEMTVYLQQTILLFQ